MDICPKCGLPKQACVCEEIARSDQKIQVSTVTRKFGKIATTVSGFDNTVDLKDLAKRLKTELACGGTVKRSIIELQGDHRKRIRQILVKIGFKEDQISE